MCSRESTVHNAVKRGTARKIPDSWASLTTGAQAAEKRQAEKNPYALYAIVRYPFSFLLSAVVIPGLQARPIKPLYNDIAGDLQAIYEVSREISFNTLNTYFLKVRLGSKKKKKCIDNNLKYSSKDVGIDNA